MSALVDRITEVLEPHQLYHEYRPLNPCAWWCRGCDWHGESYHEACAHVAERVAAALPEPLIAARIEAVRDFCTKTIEYDSMKVAAPGLTDRAWCAKGVLNILDGVIDQQLTAGWTAVEETP